MTITLNGPTARLPDETTILRFRHLLERHNLAPDMLRLVNDLLQARGLVLRSGTAMDATLLAAPSSAKNAGGERVSPTTPACPTSGAHCRWNRAATLLQDGKVPVTGGSDSAFTPLGSSEPNW